MGPQAGGVGHALLLAWEAGMQHRVVIGTPTYATGADLRASREHVSVRTSEPIVMHGQNERYLILACCKEDGWFPELDTRCADGYKSGRKNLMTSSTFPQPVASTAFGLPRTAHRGGPGCPCRAAGLRDSSAGGQVAAERIRLRPRSFGRNCELSARARCRSSWQQADSAHQRFTSESESVGVPLTVSSLHAHQDPDTGHLVR